MVGFSEVSGLSSEYEPVTYKHGLSFALGHQIIPGMRQDIRLTLKRGIMASQDFLVHWMNQTYTEMSLSNARRDLLIDLCDEAGQAVVRWTVHDALPIRLDAPTFDANSQEVAIETMELVARDLQLTLSP